MKILVVSCLIGLFACNSSSKKSPIPSDKKEVVITSGAIALNSYTNQYGIITLERTIKDSLKLTITDSSEGKTVQEKRLVRDTSYRAWWSFIVPDSTGKAIKNKAGTDSIVFRFIPIEKNMILQDYNRDWK